MTDIEVCQYMEGEGVDEKSFKNFMSGLNTTLFMAHGIEPAFVWAMDLKRAASSKQVAVDIPVVDLAPVLDCIRALHRGFMARGASALGNTPMERFLRARQVMMFIVRLDTGARSADLEGMPVAKFRTRPANVMLDKAEVVYVRFRRPKEERLRMSGCHWSGEVGIAQDPGCTDADYWATSFARWWPIYVKLRREPKTSGFYLPTDVHGYTIVADSAFSCLRGKAIGRDRMSNTVKALLVENEVMGPHTTFTAKHLRHNFATVCLRLPVEEGLMKKEQVVATLRHSGLGSLKYYLATDVHPDVRARWEATTDTKRRWDGRSQWLRY